MFNEKSQKQFRQNLRNAMPEPEKLLWYRIRNKQLDGYKFRRQHGIGVYVLDFYCPSAKLAIEIDGESHATSSSKSYDKGRQEYIESVGITVLRFTNLEITSNLDGVILTISHHLKQSNHP